MWRCEKCGNKNWDSVKKCQTCYPPPKDDLQKYYESRPKPEIIQYVPPVVIEEKEPSKINWTVLIFIGLGFLVLLGVLSSEDKPTASGAFVMSKEFVERRLKSPSTATFCSYSDARVIDLGGGRYQVSGYVDAQNSFGAKMRTYFTCTLKSSSGSSWSLEGLDIN